MRRTKTLAAIGIAATALLALTACNSGSPSNPGGGTGDGGDGGDKPLFEVAHHLRSGALEPVLCDTPPVPVTLAVMHAYTRQVPAKVRAFADLAVEDVRAHVAARLAEFSSERSHLATVG